MNEKKDVDVTNKMGISMVWLEGGLLTVDIEKRKICGDQRMAGMDLLKGTPPSSHMLGKIW